MHLSKIMIIFSILSLCFWRKNIIKMLLSLEMLLISLMFLFIFSNFLLNSFFILFFLAFTVMSSSVGLSLLVSLSRSQKKNSSSSLIIYYW
uniref:NADH-ubiquinone oxidoreductase chain 4L n=1 Tax=Atypus karschi TaxID=2337319 RepID=A0A8A5Y7V1_9ARAC|nr:NADH dehydrogenase subunit 4L [Atypus karschi]QTH31103.1 NADH dehydrogenase subunit 4L [Atypus karschi]